MRGQLAWFIVRRLAVSLPLVVGIVFVTFMLVRIGGQDPVALLAGPTASAAEHAAIRADLGLDRPLLAQFVRYVGKAASGDLGVSWLSTREVLDEITQRMWVTLELLVWGVGIGAVVAIPLGIRAAARRGSTFDQVVRAVSLAGFSIPTYWLGLIAILVFFYLLDLAPAPMGRIDVVITPPERVTGSYLIDGLLAGQSESAWSALKHLILPVCTIAIIACAPIMKQARAIAAEVGDSEYIRFARASGLGPARVRRMVFRNSMVPVLTFVGTELVGLLGTSSLIELIFSWGGIGQWGLQSILNGDFAAIQGYVLFASLLSVAVFIVVDVAVFVLEPRGRERA
ncbi:MAG: ABC transporter permease [Burkholderiales bacterium]|nr:MAG: ABC transporter permease [Burkholderiales bacterium]